MVSLLRKEALLLKENFDSIHWYQPISRSKKKHHGGNIKRELECPLDNLMASQGCPNGVG